MGKHKKKRNKAMRVAMKTAKKARRAMKDHGPLTAFLAALGGLATSVVSSENLRNAVMRFVDTKLGGAAKALEGATGDSDDEDRDELDELDGRGGEAHA